MKRQKKQYSRPQKPFDKIRIEEENVLKEKYGLKNKKEIWKADAAIGRIRNQAKKLITENDKEKNAFIERLQKKGFQAQDISEVLGLNKEDWLKRRLQTVMLDKKLVTTPKQARQLITHKHVQIGNQTVNIPSYQVNLEEESEIKLNIILKLPEKKKSKIEKIKEEMVDEKVGTGNVTPEKKEKRVSEEDKAPVEESLVKEIKEEKK